MKLKFEYKITLAYLVLGSLWILFSDKVLYHFIPDGIKLTALQTYKGWFYVITTAVLFFYFIKHHLNKNRTASFELKNKTEEYYTLYEEYKSQAENLNIAKEKVEESLQQFKLLIENAPIPIFIQTDECFAYVNKALCSLYGAENENELIHTVVLDRIHPDYKDFVRERISTLNKQQLIAPKIEYRHLKLDDTEIDVEVMAVPFKYHDKNGALVFIRDITSIKQYIKEIEEKNYFIQKVLDNLPIGIALHKFNEGTATYLNKKFEEIYGWPAKELRDIKTFFEKVYPDEDYRSKITSIIMKDIESGKAENMHWENIEITQKSGDKRIINAVNIPLTEQNTMVSTVMDITTQNLFEKELIVAKEKSEESNRLKTAFLNNISHEFRTPLNGMLGFLDLALNENLDHEKKREYYQIIKESSTQFLNILTDVVEISEIQSKIDNTKITTCNLNEIISNVINEKRTQLNKKNIELRLELDCKEEELLIQTDYHKLERSLMHVLDNAIKFTHEGNIRFNCKRDKHEVEISVTDNGIGISAEEQTRIFEPFRQIEFGETRNYGGNGIGLSLVKFNIERLGGKVSLESESGKGTKVVLRIPANNLSPDSFPKKEKAMSNINWKNKTILIVEDDWVNYQFLNEVVSDLGAKTLYAKNGLEAIDLCKGSENIDLVLMDIKMPEMNGYEATKRIKEIRPDLIVIAQSAYALQNEINQYKDVFKSYITKPINSETLIEQLKLHLAD
jgi:PAS domain S-box-containing protein